jgi:hypothetical protein
MRREFDMSPSERVAPARGLLFAVAIQTVLTAAAIIASL